LIGSALFAIAFEALYFWFCKPPLDGMHYLIGRDFLNMWIGARAALNGHIDILFDTQRYNALVQRLFSPDVPLHNWSYPPHILLLIWPFGFFSYLWAYALWVAVGLGVLLWAAGGKALGRRGILFILLAPATLLNIATGQNGFFTAALLVGALSCWDERPLLAGFLLGVLTIKPQLALLVPLVLVLTRRWRVLAAMAATAAALCAASALIWGPGIWRDYLAFTLPFQSMVMTQGPVLMQAMMPTPYMNARLLGLSADAAMLVQVPVSALALAAVAWTYRRRRDPLLSAAMLLAAALLFTPYAFGYDMMGLTVILAQLHLRADNNATDRALILALWVLPIGMIPLGFLAHCAISSILLLAFMNRLRVRLQPSQTPLNQPILSRA
jgi:hypothetical protein